MSIKKLLKEKILVLDGAMGSFIQKYGFSEEQFRGKQFINHPSHLQGDNDLLNLTQPDAIQDIHEQYLRAGADIIETNTFNANGVSQSDYGTESLIYEMNKAGAELAKRAVLNINKDAFVAGSLGPTNRTASLSPDVNNPAYRNATFNNLVNDYTNAVRGLVDGGSD
jgi:5-methyltetrahydrofolate--homocysteine methyltransferase